MVAGVVIVAALSACVGTQFVGRARMQHLCKQSQPGSRVADFRARARELEVLGPSDRGMGPHFEASARTGFFNSKVACLVSGRDGVIRERRMWP